MCTRILDTESCSCFNGDMETTPKMYSRDEAVAALEAAGFTFRPATAEWVGPGFVGRLSHSHNPADLNDLRNGPRWWLQNTNFERYPVLG